MLSDIDILKEMINKKATVQLKGQQDGKGIKYSVTLTEPQHSYSVTIDRMPKDDKVIVIDVDTYFPAPRKIFTGSKGECKRADFVIVTNTGTEKIILCLEIKKTKGTNSTIIQQLTGAQCFVAYCKEIGKAFWHKHNFLDAYQYRFVSIGHISISKKKTQSESSTNKNPNSKEIHDCPNRMRKISYSGSLRFDRLI
ncbi:hypothetical protein [Microcoleus sp. S13_C5]|uniref:hypothetical protein n=1 Tax=Microcoleus sp. S13_C5 TaxID=3055411 RepID=UPI002FD75669